MIRAKGRYRNQALELERPLPIAEGAVVEIDVHLREDLETSEGRGWADMAMSRLEQEWDNPEDSIYDDWKTLYGV